MPVERVEGESRDRRLVAAHVHSSIHNLKSMMLLAVTNYDVPHGTAVGSAVVDRMKVPSDWVHNLKSAVKAVTHRNVSSGLESVRAVAHTTTSIPCDTPQPTELIEGASGRYQGRINGNGGRSSQFEV